MLELALIFGAFLFMMIAIFDVGQYMFIHDTLMERARHAVRYGVSRTFNEAAIKNMVLYSSPTQPAGATPVFNLAPTSVTAAVNSTGPGAPSWLTVRISGWNYVRLTPTQAGNIAGSDITVTLPMELP